MIYGYLRVSTERQDLASQKVGIDNYCEKHAITIDKWVEEKVSGTKAVKERRIKTLLSNIKKGDTLVVSEISRLGRSSLMVLSIVEKLYKRGITMIFIKQGLTLDANDSNLQSMMSKMFVCFSAIYAEMERELMRTRVVEGLERRRKAGLHIGCPKGIAKANSPTKKILEEARRLYNSGETLAELSKRYNLTVSALSRALRKFGGVITRPKGRRPQTAYAY